MDFLQSFEPNQILGIIVDFGFVGGFIIVVLWILARSPFQLNMTFQGKLNVGKNGHEMAEETHYGYTNREVHPPTVSPQIIERTRPINVSPLKQAQPEAPEPTEDERGQDSDESFLGGVGAGKSRKGTFG